MEKWIHQLVRTVFYDASAGFITIQGFFVRLRQHAGGDGAVPCPRVRPRHYTEEDFRAIVYPGVPEFLHKYKGKKILSLATNSPHVFIDMALERANLTGIMDYVVTGDDAKQYKPKPDIFLLAAQTVGLPIDECLVFEDSETGLQAAKAAGMDTVMVANPGNTIPNVIPNDVWIYTWPQLNEK